MTSPTCENPRCKAPLEAGAAFCQRCGQRAGAGASPPRVGRRRRRAGPPLVVMLILFGLFAHRLQHAPAPTLSHAVQPVAPPDVSNNPPLPPSVEPSAGADRPTASDGPPPFPVVLDPSLQRFTLARLGWRENRQPWGTPAVFWADLRPVPALKDFRLPGVLLAWCYGGEATQIKRATAEWGRDTEGPVLHVHVDFNGLEHPFDRLRLGAE